MDNLNLMRKRLEWQGGIHQEDRMIKGKWETLQRVLKYSYQACTVQLVQPYNVVLDINSDQVDPETGVFQTARALINPNKVKQDYDEKVFSIDYRYNYHSGDIFEWKNTNTHWLIYLEEITEDAYFRGSIRRCRHKIKFKDNNGNWCATWAAIRGPVETQIDSIQKNQLRIDRPNMSLSILMPLNEQTKNIFDRYFEFLLDGKCWRVQTINAISMENVLEVNAGEYYIDRDTDDIEAEMKDGLIVEPVNPSPGSMIQGEGFIKPKIEEIYIAPEPGGSWSIVEQGCPAAIKKLDEVSISLVWTKGTSGQFTLQWTKGDVVDTRVIVVESLF